MPLFGNDNTSTTTSGPPPEIMEAFKKLMGRAEGIANQPLQQYSGNLVAGLSPSQQAAITRINDASGIGQPYINSAAEYLGKSAAPVSTAAPGIAAGAGSAANNAATTAGNAATSIAGTGAAQAGTQAEQGIQMARSGATDAAARANAAASTDVAASLPSFQNGIAQYMSPYQGQVVDATRSLFNNQNAMDDEKLKGSIISSGAWGGDRAGVAQGIAAGQRSLSQDAAIANLMNQGFQQGTSQYNTDTALKAGLGQNRANLMASTALGGGNLLSSTGTATGGLGANTALSGASLGANTALGAGSLGATTALGAGNLGVSAAGQDLQAQQLNRSNAATAGQGIAALGSQAQNMELAGADAQMKAGGLEQAIDQAQLNVPYQQFLQQQQYPFQTTQWLASLISGIAGGSGGTSTTTTPGPSAASTLGGLGLGAYALFSDKRVKEGIERVGTLNDGTPIHRYNYKGDPTPRIGLLAQEVEKRKPEAVHDVGGIKAVDYDKATEDSTKRARGGGIIPEVPGIDLSFIPEVRDMQRGSSIPKAPAPSERGDGIADIMSSLDKFDRIRKMLGRKRSNPLGADDDTGDREFNFGDGIGIAAGAERSTGGYVGDDDRFGPGIVGGQGIAIPRLSMRPRTPYVIQDRLTRPFSSRAADENGKSLLPSTTYIPPVAPWTTPKDEEKKDDDKDAKKGGNAEDNYQQNQGGPDRKRGGRLRRDEGGIVSMDDDGENMDEGDAPLAVDDDDAPLGIASDYLRAPGRMQTLELKSEYAPTEAEGIVAKAKKMPFVDYDHEGPDDVAGGEGIAAGDDRYKPRYRPRTIADSSEDDAAEAKKMALLAAAAGMLGKRNLGEGLSHAFSQGAQTYMTMKEKAKDRKAKAEDRADQMAYRADTLRLTGVKAEDAARNFGSQIEIRKRDLAQRGKHMENQDATAAARAAELRRHNQTMEGHRATEVSNKNSGTFKGTGMDQQSWNIILDPKSDPASPAYAAAWAEVTKPVLRQMVDPADQTLKMAEVTPEMPPNVRRPAHLAKPAAAAAAAPTGAAPSGGGAPPAAAATAPPAGGGAPPAADAPPAAGQPGSGVKFIGGSSTKPLTESQAKANMFGTLMEKADGEIRPLEVPGDIALNIWRLTPEALQNYALSENDQKYFNALKTFAAGILRKETGASFTNTELKDVQSRFFPMPGNTPDVLDQKASSRKQAIESMRAEMPDGKFRGVINQQKKGDPATEGRFAGMSMGEIAAIDPKTLTPVEQAQWRSAADRLVPPGGKKP